MSHQTLSEPATDDIPPEAFRLYNGDSTELADTLPKVLPDSEFVDTTITSPPYADLKDYGFDNDVQVGQNSSYEDYLDELRDIFGQIYDLTTETGSLWVVANTFRRDHRLYQLPFDIADVCQNLSGTEYCPHCEESNLQIPLTTDRGTHERYCENCDRPAGQDTDSWILQEIVIWDKQRARPYASDAGLRNVFEYILCFSKTTELKFTQDAIRHPDPASFKKWWVDYPERYHPRGKLPENIWEMLTPTQGSWGNKSYDHPAPFPPALIERILKLTTDDNDIVFDPFAGTGSVLAQATAMNRRSLGFEYNDTYCDAYDDLKDDLTTNHTETNSLEARQRDLEQLISSLRQTRHARELVRLVAKDRDLDTPNDLPIGTIYQICTGIGDSRNGTDFIGSSLYVSTTATDSDTREALATALRERSETPPLSKYDIDATITVTTPSEIHADVTANQYNWLQDRLYKYTTGTHNVYTTQTNIRDWIQDPSSTNDNSAGGYPPILSNRGLTVPKPTQTNGTVTYDDEAVTLEFGPLNDTPTTIEFPTPTHT